MYLKYYTTLVVQDWLLLQNERDWLYSSEKLARFSLCDIKSWEKNDVDFKSKCEILIFDLISYF